MIHQSTVFDSSNFSTAINFFIVIMSLRGIGSDSFTGQDIVQINNGVAELILSQLFPKSGVNGVAFISVNICLPFVVDWDNN